MNGDAALAGKVLISVLYTRVMSACVGSKMCVPIVTVVASTRVDPVIKMYDVGMFNMGAIVFKKHDLSCTVTFATLPVP
jgi:hypothetical protein